MPRPSHITKEQIQGWKERLGPLPETLSSHTPKWHASYLEAGLAGSWLGDPLHEAKVDSDTITDSCTACGQISFGRDPWEVAEKVLLLTSSGRLLKPGLLLADALHNGAMDAEFGPGPGFHSADAIRRMKEAMDIQNLDDLVARVGASSLDDAHAKVKTQVENLRQKIERR
jgi:hypothetical protein